MQDEEARAFISHCCGPPEMRPSAGDLLEDPFLLAKKTPPPELRQQDSEQHLAADSGKRGWGSASQGRGASAVCCEHFDNRGVVLRWLWFSGRMRCGSAAAAAA